MLGKTLLESVPKPLRWLVRPALLGSIGLHVLLLLMPIADRSSLETVASEPETQVPVSRLPENQRTKAPQPKPTPTPTPKVAAPTPTPKPLIPAPVSPQRLPIQIPPAQVQPKVQSQVQPQVQPSPVPAQPTPLATPSPVASPDPVPPPALPFADVPVLAGSQTGCFGLGTCHQMTDGTNFRTAGQTLEQELSAKGYRVKLRDDIEETGRKVYEISKNNETRYLNVLSSDVGSTVYLVTTQPVSLSELQGSETLKTELEALLDGLPNTAANAMQFAQPEAFFVNATPRPETGGKLRFVANTSPDQLLNALTSQLQAQNYSLTDAGGYGGGLLYEVTKGAFTGYLNLVPTSDRSGMIVVLWTNLPS